MPKLVPKSQQAKLPPDCYDFGNRPQSSFLAISIKNIIRSDPFISGFSRCCPVAGFSSQAFSSPALMALNHSMGKLLFPTTYAPPKLSSGLLLSDSVTPEATALVILGRHNGMELSLGVTSCRKG